MIARRSWLCRCGAPADGLHGGRRVCVRCLGEQGEPWADRYPRLAIALAVGCGAAALVLGWVALHVAKVGV